LLATISHNFRLNLALPVIVPIHLKKFSFSGNAETLFSVLIIKAISSFCNLSMENMEISSTICGKATEIFLPFCDAALRDVSLNLVAFERTRHKFGIYILAGHFACELKNKNARFTTLGERIDVEIRLNVDFRNLTEKVEKLKLWENRWTRRHNI
jgi:hypothetical protein